MLFLFFVYLIQSNSVNAQQEAPLVRKWDIHDIVEKDIIPSLEHIKNSYREYGVKPQGEDGFILFGERYWRRITSFYERGFENALTETLFVEHFWGDYPPWFKLKSHFIRIPKDKSKKIEPRFTAVNLLQGIFSLKLNRELEKELFASFYSGPSFLFSFKSVLESEVKEVTEIKLRNSQNIIRIEETDPESGLTLIRHRFQKTGAADTIEYEMVIHSDNEGRFWIPEVRYYFDHKEISQAQYEAEMASRLLNQFNFGF